MEYLKISDKNKTRVMGVAHMLKWIVDRWDAELSQRPLKNVHYRGLDVTWRQLYRFVSDGEELPRPTHAESLDIQKLTGGE